MDNLRNILKKINIDSELIFNEPMSAHTTFKTGGPADVYVAPADTHELKQLLAASAECNTDVFILGGGANLLVSDKGIRGIVIDVGNFNKAEITADGEASFGAGMIMDRAAEYALSKGFAGLDSFYGMPGTVGGAVWMNARCYGRSISDIITSALYLDESLEVISFTTSGEDFAYKHSPFQSMKSVIIEASFRLEKADPAVILAEMLKNRGDREAKGHYAGPSAGSVFKNNRDFGRPSGSIIDSLHLRGTRVGGAKISDQHANIFINDGDASSMDIYRLIQLTRSRVKEAYGYDLEPEVQLIGDFTDL